MFVRSGRAIEFVKPGSTFRRIGRNKTVETARVLAVSADAFGIPHVRFELDLDRPSRSTVSREPRTLALRIFADTYTERVNNQIERVNA